MNNVKHTPGPWHVEKTPTTLWIGLKRPKSRKVEAVVVDIDVNGVKPGVRKRAIADAYLIAAAPELLRSLKGCLAILKDELAGILEANCPDDENGIPIREQLYELAIDDVEDYERVVADIESVIAAAEGGGR